MVKGLDLFRKYFREYADRYVLIDGAACDLAMGEAGLDFRATKDLDIVPSYSLYWTGLQNLSVVSELQSKVIIT